MPSPRIFDCMLFFNELDLLEIRLNELSEIVDEFVIVESNHTFSGHPKPLFYRDNQDRFTDYRERITHVVVHDLPTGEDHWEREHHQRRALRRGLIEAQPGDIVMMSDADEIPKAEAVAQLGTVALPAGFIQPVYYGWVDVISTVPESHRRWIGTRAVAYRDFRDPEELRGLRDGLATVLDPGGWHFSYLGGSNAVRAKLQAYSHQEFNTPAVAQGFEERIRSGLDPFGRSGYEFAQVPLDARTHPKYLVENIDRFGHLLVQPGHRASGLADQLRDEDIDSPEKGDRR